MNGLLDRLLDTGNSNSKFYSGDKKNIPRYSRSHSRTNDEFLNEDEVGSCV